MTAQVQASPTLIAAEQEERPIQFAPWARRGTLARLAGWTGRGAMLRLGPSNVLAIGISLWVAGALTLLLSR